MNAENKGGQHVFNYDLNFISLFENWKVIDIIDLGLVLLLTASLSVGLEVLKWTKVYALTPHYTETRLYLIGIHCFKAFLQCVQVIMSYLLMLLIMKGHLWIWTAMILGGALGYFLCGWTAIQIRRLPPVKNKTGSLQKSASDEKKSIMAPSTTDNRLVPNGKTLDVTPCETLV